jgi:hypothetical protein
MCHRRRPPPPSTCVGEWGTMKGKWDNSTILVNSGFQITSQFSGREDKTTLNTDAISSSVLLGCPKDYKFIQIAYVGHSWMNETATMAVEPSPSTGAKANIITKLPYDPPVPYRLLKFSQKFSAPSKITLLGKMPGAFLEIAIVVCSK